MIQWPYFVGGPLDCKRIPWDPDPGAVQFAPESMEPGFFMYPPAMKIVRYERKRIAYKGSPIPLEAFVIDGEDSLIWEQVLAYALINVDEVNKLREEILQCA